MQITGKFSLYAPAMAFKTLRPPTENVTTHAPTPRALAYPSAAYPALSSLQHPTLVSLGSSIKWSRRVRLKSPGTVKRSVIPIWTSRRAKWPPRVASHEVTGAVGTESWMAETEPLDGQQTTSLAGLLTSREPIMVSID